MEIRCFMTAPTIYAKVWARTYMQEAAVDCKYGYHNGMTVLGYEQAIWTANGGCYRVTTESSDVAWDKWPTKCGYCDYVFKISDTTIRQVFTALMYCKIGVPMASPLIKPVTVSLQELDGPSCWPQRELPVGAMYYTDSYQCWDNKEGQDLIVVTPGGEWNIDSRCNNCSMPEDRTHRCWVRHGVPPAITVNKQGLTCSAGAGSIQTKTFHGMIENGILRSV